MFNVLQYAAEHMTNDALFLDYVIICFVRQSDKKNPRNLGHIVRYVGGSSGRTKRRGIPWPHSNIINGYEPIPHTLCKI
jgi:hypothetical protein